MTSVALNQATFETVDTPAFLEAAAAAGVTQVGLWRHKLGHGGAGATAELARRAGLEVTSLCRGGFFTAPSRSERRRAIRDTCAAVEEAAALGCRVLVLVCGPAADGDLPGARATIARAIEDVVPFAAAHGIRLAIEPFHPVFAADRSAIITLDQACDIAERFDPATVGVAVDTFHVWWDPGLERAIARATDRIATLQLADWPAEMGVPLRGRALPGDGVAPLAGIVGQVLAAGYDGPVEVEVLSEQVWARPALDVALTARERTEQILATARTRLEGTTARRPSAGPRRPDGHLPGAGKWPAGSERPRVLVAPDDFKGTFTAPQVATAVARGLREAGVEADELPIADGGNGTLAALVAALGGEQRVTTVSDPLGRPVDAMWALLPGGRTAIVEMAEASGLGRVAADERDAWAASTRGTGELIAAAARAGAAQVLVCVGGSATTDGGMGAIDALRDAGVDVAITVLCDVRVPFEDAARVFAPQKGADPATVERLTARLHEVADAAPRNPRGIPMTGAAGGLAGGLWAFCGAELVSGASYVLDAVGFDERVRGAALVVTGEGRFDEQTLAGKAVAEVAARTRAPGVPLHVIAGSVAIDADQAAAMGVAGVTAATTLVELEAAGRDLGHALTASATPRREGHATTRT